MKKIMFYTSIIALNSCLYASEGGYVGINVGAGSANNAHSSQAFLQGNFIPGTQLETVTQGSNILGDIKLGYRFLFDNLYAAIEGLWGISNVYGEHERGLALGFDSEEKGKFRLRDTFALNSHIGFQINDFLAYLIVGFSYSYWKSGEAVTINPAIGLPRSNSKNEYLPGFTIGIGSHKKISEKISLGLEYIHTWYKKNSFIVNDVASVVQPNTNLYVSNQHRLHKVYLSVTYHL